MAGERKELCLARGGRCICFGVDLLELPSSESLSSSYFREPLALSCSLRRSLRVASARSFSSRMRASRELIRSLISCTSLEATYPGREQQPRAAMSPTDDDYLAGEKKCFLGPKPCVGDAEIRYLRYPCVILTFRLEVCSHILWAWLLV